MSRKQKSGKKYLKFGIALVVVIYFGLVEWNIYHNSFPQALAGIDHLRQGQTKLLKDNKQANILFSQASDELENSFASLRAMPAWVKIATPLPPFRWQIRLLKSCYSLSEAGNQIAILANTFPQLNADSKDTGLLVTNTTNQYLTWFNEHQSALLTLQDLVKQADTELQAVPSWTIIGHQKEINNFQNNISQAVDGLRSIIGVTDKIGLAFGKSDTGKNNTNKNILIVFQNDAELRPSGGFIGSYAEMIANNGYLRQFKFGENIYKFDTNQNVTPIPAVEPLNSLNPNLTFRDSNVGKGFISDQSTQIANIFQLYTGQSVDDIIFLNASILQDYLKLTGPVILPSESGVTIDADNLYSALAKEVEITYFTDELNKQTNQPKQVLFDLIPALIDKLSKSDSSFTKTGQLLSDAIDRKSLQFWSSNSDVNSFIKTKTPTDQPLISNTWMKVVNTNLGGLKSSINIKQEINIQTIQNKGNVYYDTTITRTHTGNGVWPDYDNHNYMEVYLPSDAEITDIPKGNILTSPLDANIKNNLASKSWITKVEKTDNYKKIEFWASTKVGQATEYHLNFTLPEKTSSVFTILKQAGSRNDTVVFNNKKYTLDSNLVLE